MEETAVIAQLQAENEELRRKLAFLFMRQESLWQHFKAECRYQYRAWRAAHSEEEFQLLLIIVMTVISVLIDIIRKKFL